jgi:hypothetical protein
MTDWNGNARVGSLILAVLLGLGWPIKGEAQVEVEVDPFAYALNGFSLHVAKVLGSVRVNVGTFGIDVPGAIHGNDGWSEAMRGAGIKVDYLGSSLDGLFVGVDGGYMRTRYGLTAGDETVVRGIVGMGLRAGYRVPLGWRGLYVAPWGGVSYNFDGDEVAIEGETFERSAVRPFATVHVGWRF